MGSAPLFDQFPARGKTPSALASQSFPGFWRSAARTPASRSQSRRATNCATPRYEVRRSGWAYSPKPPALPTALIPDIRFFCMILCGEGKSKFFVSVGSAVVKAGFAGGSSGGGFPPQATVPRTSGLSLLGEWIDRLSSQSRRATNCATPGYEVVGWPGRILPKEVLSIFYSCL